MKAKPKLRWEAALLEALWEERESAVKKRNHDAKPPLTITKLGIGA